ncbi:MAG: oligosaccharide flippase family protein [Clostridium sp.]|nr:oligosaccharide flippase family protein [Clostridium sp.]MCM1444670.1 oligosaccharide flippase family protein [Candidatus Amulumruptor caecigallinarius]
MDVENKILKNAFYYTLSSIIVMIVSFLSLTIFTYILKTEEYGIVNFFTSTVNILTIILSLSFTTASSRFYYDKGINYKSFVKTTITFILIYNAISFVIIFLLRNYISSYLNISNILLILILIGTFLNIFIEYYSGYLTATQNAKRYLMVKNLPLILNTIFTIILVLMFKDTDGAYIRILCILFFNLVLVAFLFFKYKKVFSEKFDRVILKNVLLYSVPIVVHLLSNYLLTYFDKLTINQYIGTSSMGIYAFATKIAEILLLFINAINLSWAPVFYSNEGNYDKVKSLLKKYFQIILFAFLGITFFAENFAKLIISSEYYEALSIVPLLAFGYMFVFLYQIYINYSLYKKKTINITINTILSAVLNIVLNIIFVPKYGYIAAAVSTVISYIFLFGLHYFNSKVILKGKVFEIKNFKFEFLTITLGVIIYLITKYCIKIEFICILIRILFLVLIIIRYNIIDTVLKIIFKGGKKNEKGI